VESAENAKDRITAKAGPLPVWGWALLIGIGLYVYYRYSKNKSGSTDTTATTESSNSLSDADIAAGVIGADYDLRNTLGVTNSDVAQLATNVNTNTAAIKAGTKEEKDENKKPSNYAVLAYGGHEYELGRESGAELTKAEERKSKVKHPEKGTRYVQLKWAPKNFFKLGEKVPQHLTEEEFKKLKGHPKATVVSSNTHVNVAPSKVRD